MAEEKKPTLTKEEPTLIRLPDKKVIIQTSEGLLKEVIIRGDIVPKNNNG